MSDPAYGQNELFGGQFAQSHVPGVPNNFSADWSQMSDHFRNSAQGGLQNPQAAAVSLK